MGGMNLAVNKNVTGKDPEALPERLPQPRNNARMQGSQGGNRHRKPQTPPSLNPTYIKEKKKEGAGDASGFADIIR